MAVTLVPSNTKNTIGFCWCVSHEEGPRFKCLVLDLGLFIDQNPGSVEEISLAVGEQLNAGTTPCRVAGGTGGWESWGRTGAHCWWRSFCWWGPAPLCETPSVSQMKQLRPCHVSHVSASVRFRVWKMISVSLLFTLIPTEYRDRFYLVHQTCIFTYQTWFRGGKNCPLMDEQDVVVWAVRLVGELPQAARQVALLTPSWGEQPCSRPGPWLRKGWVLKPAMTHSIRITGSLSHVAACSSASQFSCSQACPANDWVSSWVCKPGRRPSGIRGLPILWLLWCLAYYSPGWLCIGNILLQWRLSCILCGHWCVVPMEYW